MAIEHSRPDEVERCDRRVEAWPKRGRMEEERDAQLGKAPVDRVAAGRGNRLAVHIRADTDTAEAERPHGVIERLDRRLAVLHRQRCEPVVAAGMVALELGLL